MLKSNAWLIVTSCRRFAVDWLSRLDDFYATHLDLLEQLRKAKPSYKTIKIAILDTGINEKHPDIYPNTDRIVQRKSWIDDGSDMLDTYESGHCTHTAVLVLQTAPFAHICVARICKDKNLQKIEHIKEVSFQNHSHRSTLMKRRQLNGLSMSMQFPTNPIQPFPRSERDHIDLA